MKPLATDCNTSQGLNMEGLWSMGMYGSWPVG
jgi:hypothetical protein